VTDGRLFLALAALICAGVFLTGLRFSRMSDEKVQGGRVQMELPPFLMRGRTKVEQVHLFGRMMMIAAPLFLLFLAALAFGLLGPSNIAPIRFN
jgi:hypothetical protein